MKRRFTLKNFLIKALIAYLVLVAVIFFIQRNLLYYPFGDYRSPQELGMNYVQELHLATADDKQALAWFAPPMEDSSGKVVVFFHGNGGGIVLNRGVLNLLREAQLGYLAVEYRGYPGYEGKTTEQGIYHDARASMEFLFKQGYEAEDIVLFGQSLGSGVAVQMATEYDVGLLVLLSPFTAIADAAASIYWYLPVQYLVLDRFDSFSKIQDVTAPVYIFHGTEDTLVPFSLGQRLYEQANDNKRFFELTGQDHNRVDIAAVIREIAAFAEKETP